jgi:hypothetical protein
MERPRQALQGRLGLSAGDVFPHPVVRKKTRCRLALRLCLAGLEPLALACRKIARLRQLRVFAHRSVHPNVNAFRVTATAHLNPGVVHLWSASVFSCSALPGLPGRNGSGHYFICRPGTNLAVRP